MNRFLLKFTIFYSGLLFIIASFKHFLLGNGVGDIGLFEQFTWLIANGKINSISSLALRSPLQDHFSLILILVASLYKVLPYTYTLLGLQSIALGTLPAITCSYLSIERQLNYRYKAIIFSIILCPSIFLVNIANFHPEVITAPLMLIAIHESVQRGFMKYYLSFFFILAAKKSQILFGYGLVIYLLFKKKFGRAYKTFLISTSWWLIAAKFTEVHGDFIQLRLGYLGETKLKILESLLFTPWKIFEEAPLESIILYTIGLILPFLALLGKESFPSLISAFPIYFTNIISANGMQRELYSHYSIAIIPFILYGCIEEINNINQRYNQKSKYYITIVLAIISFLGYGRIVYFQSRYIPRLKEAIALQQVKKEINNDSSVLTSSNYASHFANRENINSFDNIMAGGTDNIKDMKLNDYKHIVLPEIENLNLFKGKFNPVTSQWRLLKMKEILKEAEDLNYNCEIGNEYIRLCSRRVD